MQVYVGKDSVGKNIYKSVTAGTKKEAEYLASMMALYHQTMVTTDVPVKDALRSFVESRKNVISPSTYREYCNTISRAYEKIENLRISKLSKTVVQSWINEGAKTKSAKTLKNEFNLLASALKQLHKEMSIEDYRFPQKVKSELYIPTEEDIRTILSIAEGDYKVAVLLAAFGTMRRSEICALTPGDLDGNIASVNKAMVKDINKEWVIKTTKTTGSTRRVILPQFVADEFRRSGPLKTKPDVITNTHIKVLKKAGVPHFRFHDYRHFSASILHAMGMPDKYIMERGGWTNNKTLQNIYQHTFDDISTKENNRVNDYFSSIIK